MYTLYIANKNYSSWSLRGWLCARLSGAPFDEQLVQLATGGPNAAYLSFSPSGLVPCLHDGDVVVWESLAIAEYLAERHPGMWPADAKARAFARSMCAEMHAGFRHLRNDMTMCIRERVDVRPWSPHLTQDIERVYVPLDRGTTAFRRRRSVPVRRVVDRRCVLRAGRVPLPDLRRGATGRGRRYWRRLLAHPDVREWERAALAETTIIEVDEPRHIYRDKLRAQGRL